MSKIKSLYVIPCSGIGKPLGTVSRKATYKIIDELHPKNTQTTCLALLTIGDKETLEKIRNSNCISIDGCPMKCAKKNIEASKGNLIKTFTVTDFLKTYRELKPKGIIKLNFEGEKLATFLAEEVGQVISDTIKEEIKSTIEK